MLVCSFNDTDITPLSLKKLIFPKLIYKLIRGIINFVIRLLINILIYSGLFINQPNIKLI